MSSENRGKKHHLREEGMKEGKEGGDLDQFPFGDSDVGGEGGKISGWKGKGRTFCFITRKGSLFMAGSIVDARGQMLAGTRVGKKKGEPSRREGGRGGNCLRGGGAVLMELFLPNNECPETTDARKKKKKKKGGDTLRCRNGRKNKDVPKGGGYPKTKPQGFSGPS